MACLALATSVLLSGACVALYLRALSRDVRDLGNGLSRCGDTGTSSALRLEMCKLDPAMLDREERLLHQALAYYRHIEKSANDQEKNAMRRTAENAFLPGLTPYEKLRPSELIEMVLGCVGKLRERHHGKRSEREGA